MCGPDLFKSKKIKNKNIYKADIEKKMRLATQQAEEFEAGETVAVRCPPTEEVSMPERSTSTLPKPLHKVGERGPPKKLEQESGAVAEGSRVEEQKVAETVTEDRNVTPVLSEKSTQVGKSTVQKAGGLATDTAETGVGVAVDATTEAATTATQAAKTGNITIHNSIAAPVVDTVTDTATSAVQTTVDVAAPIPDTVVRVVSRGTRISSQPSPISDDVLNSGVANRDVTSTAASTVAAKASNDDAVVAEETALEQKPKVEQVTEGNNAAAKAEGGGRGQNPIYDFFFRKGK